MSLHGPKSGRRNGVLTICAYLLTYHDAACNYDATHNQKIWDVTGWSFLITKFLSEEEWWILLIWTKKCVEFKLEFSPPMLENVMTARTGEILFP